MSKYSPENVNTLGLIRSLRIYTLNRKHQDPTLNYASFAHATNASEEDVDPLTEHYAFKEAMKIQFKEKFHHPLSKKSIIILIASIGNIVSNPMIKMEIPHQKK